MPDPTPTCRTSASASGRSPTACASSWRPTMLAPVVAINLWYAVGSRHEQPGKTGFAHLFEHFMFQGSRHVAKAEHMAIVQGAGGVNNATTYFDRTNYFETLPSHQLELGLWLEADRMATLLDALSQDNLDNQREVVKNEKRQSYDNRPYGTFYEKLMAARLPRRPPVPPHAHRLDGGPRRGQPRRRDRPSSAPGTGPTNAVLTIAGDVDEEPAFDAAERFFGPIAAARRGARRSAAADRARRLGGETREVVPRRGAARARPLRLPHARPTGPPAFDALEVATQILAGGRGSRLHRRLVRDERVAQDVAAFSLPLVAGQSILAGWVTARPESRGRDRGAHVPRGARSAGVASR